MTASFYQQPIFNEHSNKSYMDYLDMNNAQYNRHIHQKKQHNAVIHYAMIVVIVVLTILH